MSTHPRILLLGLSAVFALGTVSACAGGSSTETAPSSATSSGNPSGTPTAAAFPPSAKYIADMEKDGRTMTIGIAVDGDSVAAYACNGSDDEAWFFGADENGSIDLTSRFRDTLSASFDGTDVDGNLTMDGVTYTFTAAEVPAPAGMYTAALNGVRESWVLRPNGSAVGVQFGGMGGGSDFGEFERQQLADAQFRAEVRNRRLLRPAGDLEQRPDGTWGATIDGQPVEAVVVDGNFRLG
ncbi:hypothetical protein A5757_09610 [Mycobacterium sp. 852013-51886_SCH5428379]|uniref:hypothetical protein n=1 Tax=Mycobacterium sp. 852013-51886_SCH5428379 TaxID=1834111 RepID=UPI000801F47E|nr:hypothetical protein [Mycobacterium sp. 852013-51886_SCH5428379]OBB60339.1 hypothetical protein A5757_09610 [Mycobacterium sp. 852013-51886_SCH5428379]